MNRFFLTVFLVIALVGKGFTQNSKTQSNSQQPNIIFIFIDDMGYGDLSSCENEKLQKQNIDQLADESIKLTNLYTASPFCPPARVSVITGQSPSRWQIHSYLAGSDQNKKRDMPNYLDPGAPSI